MGTGDYICVTLRGCAPWGFTLREAEGDTYRPLLVSQVEEGGCAFLAGVQNGDEVVSLNGEPCADLTLLQALALIDASTGCVQLLLKRYGTVPSEDDELEELHYDQQSSEALESTTLHILSSDRKKSESNKALPKEPQLISTELHLPPSIHDDGGQTTNEEDGLRCLSPGDMVELQVSLSEQTLNDAGCPAIGSHLVILEDLPDREVVEVGHATEAPPPVPICVREPLGQRGVVLSSHSMLSQVEVIVQPPAASGAGRSILGVGGPEVIGSAGSQSEGEEGGGTRAPGSLTVSFGLPSEEATTAEERDSDSDGEQDKPHKHRAKHARLRRSESQSDKQLKEAKSKCKRIALLLTAAPPHPNNKGVLMFKKHRQRAKKYTLVSYGTGEDDPDSSDEEDEENEDDRGESHTVEIKLVVPDPELDKHFISKAHNSKEVCAFNWDKGLLEIERNLKNQAEMECLPETKGKGALMFAQRRQRMEEISAEHEELRRQGLPVESINEAEKKTMEQSYIQSTTEAHTYMDVNIHQQSHQQHQYQKYQEQQYYEQQQHYQQQQQEQQQHQQLQQQQIGQHNFQQQQMYQQQQGYCQEQQQTQHYSARINGTVQHQSSEMQTSFNNRTAKPFSVESMAATPYPPQISGINQDSVGHGEQIASRDERIATPAIKTGLLLESKKKNAGKPMFTFKEAPKVSPNPALLNLLNRNDKKLGFESGPEEDYLSLGAEACNFLQSSVKHKTPPPVAPKPAINPNSFPWSSQMEVTNQDMPQQAENSLSPPAVVPATESTPAPEVNPAPAPVCEPSPLQVAQEVPASTTTIDQPAWTLPETESQPQLPAAVTQEEYDHINPTRQPESVPVSSWTVAQTHPQQQPPTNSWPQAQVQPHAPTPSQSPPQPPWITRQPSQTVAQHPPVTNAWTSQNQSPWNQPQEQTQAQPTWAHSNESPSVQPMQPPWGQPQDKPVQHQVPWAQSSQSQSPHQPQWIQQPQHKPQAQAPWVQQAQLEPQQQPPWIQQQQQQVPQQVWLQAQEPTQPQPPWVSSQPQQASWPQTQAQAHAQIQPPWIQSTQAQAPVQTEANVNPWAPMPPQTQPQQSWGQQPPGHSHQPPGHSHQPPSSWPLQQNPTKSQHQAPWAQAAPPQPKSQPNWQSSPQTSPQPPMNSWPPAQPQVSGNAWAPQPQPPSGNVSTPTVSNRPSPKPWQPQQNVSQNRAPPSPPQRMHSFTVGQRASSPINPMATVLDPSSHGSAFEMPAVRGKGADMFAKRRSRMDKYVVDSETVEANKASRSTSPAASLPNEWKYTPNVRAPPSRAYNPIQSPFYPPAASKQPIPGSPSTKQKKKGKGKETPAPKPLNVIDVMKHQPYQLKTSLFIFGDAPEPEKLPVPKPESLPTNPPIESGPVRYEQMAPVQPNAPFNASYPQPPYGMPMQPMMHDGQYQQNPTNNYPPPTAYQQPPGGPYQQPYDQHYPQPVPPFYQPQAPQSPTSPYQQAPQVTYQPTNSPPYLATPSAPYQVQPQISYVALTNTVTTVSESASSGNPATAPKPKFTAKKSSAQALGRSYSLSPPGRMPSLGQKSVSASSSPKPPARSCAISSTRQPSWPERVHKPISPWEAASRHPLGLVDEAFVFQNLQHDIASNVRLAAQRKTLPEPPAEWKVRASHQSPQKTSSYPWSQSRGQIGAPLPSFVSPTRSSISSLASPVGYRSLPRQWRPQRSWVGANQGPSLSYTESKPPSGQQVYKSVHTSNTWSWRR